MTLVICGQTIATFHLGHKIVFVRSGKSSCMQPLAPEHVPLFAAPVGIWSDGRAPSRVEATSKMMVHQAELLKRSIEHTEIPGTELKISRVTLGPWAIGG